MIFKCTNSEHQNLKFAIKKATLSSSFFRWQNKILNSEIESLICRKPFRFLDGRIKF